MTTTAHEDQYLAAPEPVREPMSREAILRRNIAALEVALRTQTERAEAAEAELAKLREQKPVAWMREDGNLYLAWQKDLCLPEVRFSPLYTAPASHKGATHCDDCGLTWLDDGLNPLGCPYCKDSAPAPAVPAEWRMVMDELLANDGADGSRYDSNKWLAARDKARALLQSAEVAK